MKKVFLVWGFVSLSTCLFGQVVSQSQIVAQNQARVQSALNQGISRTQELEEVVVSAVRATGQTPVAHTDVDEAFIRQNNTASSIPYVLGLTPSVVAFNENGTAVGNTSFRIRGTSSSRINVTLNGIPQNNPESQEVFWVNLPALSYSIHDIQVQRGVGTSTNGPGAFGASVHMKSSLPESEPYLEASSAVGSYDTYESVLAAGTGQSPSGWALDARYSKVLSQGYVRNGLVDHQSFYASLSRRTSRDWLQMKYLAGEQHTGITWEGATTNMLASDRRFNPAGLYYDQQGNERYYDNETDNYYQNVAQVLYSRKLNDAWMVHGALNYTHGYGYYENYRMDQKYSKFGLDNQQVDDQLISRTDVIRRKIMKNHYYVATATLRYRAGGLLFQTGGMASYYDGDHYGRLIWLMIPGDITAPWQWYRNEGRKKDGHLFAKAEYVFAPGWTGFADMQYRFVGYRLTGTDDDLADITQKHNWNFLNPKIGVHFEPSLHHRVFGSVAVAHREPSRADIKDIPKYGGADVVKAERMIDYELGYQYASGWLTMGANLYFMDYRDQMVSTGKLTDTGYALMENVPDSYRAGLELSARALPWKWLQVDAHATLSRNKIRNYTEWRSMYDNPSEWNPLPQDPMYRGTTDISFSPNVTGAAMLTWLPADAWRISWGSKWVGAQYFDNTSDPASRLSPYWVNNLQASHSFRLRGLVGVEVSVMVNNIFDRYYSANAWGYTSYFSDGSAPEAERRYFPQAPRNFLARFSFKF